MKTYIPPSIHIYRDWENNNTKGECIRTVEHPEYMPTDRQMIVIEATREALDRLKQEGKYPYNIDVDNIVGELLNVAPENPLRHSNEKFNVCGGLFRMDGYLANKYIDRQELIRSNVDLINSLNLSIGMKIGKIRINSKTAKACTIIDVSRDGIDLSITLGSKKYKLFVERIKNIKQMTVDAGNNLFLGA